MAFFLPLAPAVPGALAALGKAAAFVGTAAAAAWGTHKAIEAVKADDAASDELDDTATVTVACATCPQNPCAHLACGVPGSQYRGGAHGCVGRPGNKTSGGGAIHSHHAPADAYSPLPRPVGPAIQMTAADHRATSSYGSRVHGPQYAAQRQALAGGHVMRALVMDAAEARAIARASGDPARYDQAIAQMMAYANCLRQHGIIR